MQEPTEAESGRNVHPESFPWLFMIVLFGAGFAIRWWLSRKIPIIEPDGAYYARLAQEIVGDCGSHGFHPAWPPFYPWLIALAARPLLGGHAIGLGVPLVVESSGRLVNSVLGAALPCLLFFPARRLGGRRAGLAAAALAAFHPRLLEFSTQVLTEMPFTFLVALFFLVLMPGQEDSRSGLIRATVAGVSGAAAYLTRPEGFLLLPLGMGAILSGPFRRKGRAIAAFVFAALFLAVSAPHAIRVSRAVGYPSLGAKSDYNLTMAYAGARGVPRFDRTRSTYNNLIDDCRGPSSFHPEPVPRFRLVSFVLKEPATVARHVLSELPSALGALPSLAYPPFVLLALFGIFGRRRRPTREEALWLIFWLCQVGLYSLVFVYRRFFAAAIPFLVIEAAIGCALLTRNRPRWWLPALVAVLSGYGLFTAWRHTRRADYALEQRQLVQEMGPSARIRTQPGPGSGAIMARRPFAAYYSGSSILAMADAPVDNVADSARSRGAEYLLIDERDLVVEKPDFARFLGEGAAATSSPGKAPAIPATLELIESAGVPPHRITLFRVRDAAETLSVKDRSFSP
jgi:4-amino-4-deoxy-L-arabinose transferase-like glycosyltransferase